MAKITENAQQILQKRYFINGETKAEEMFRRVAHEVAQAEVQELRDLLEEEFFSEMDALNFLPNSPCLMNAGTSMKQYSACFVLPVEDSIESIFDSYKYAALVSKTGGGTGFSYSRLRSKGSKVGSTNGVASGPVSWLKIQDVATEQVKQGGRRRGANMGCLDVYHDDIKEFITCKSDGKSLSNFNISIVVPDEFMEKVKQGASYETEIFNLACHNAWLRGDPGVIFIDKINRDNPTPHLGKIESTNPCGEQPLLPFEACNLGSINLFNMVIDGKVDYKKLERTTRIAVRFLDNVIDVSEFPLPQITELVRGNRKIGLGVMGWADMLFALNIPYNSQEALDLAEKVMQFIHDIGHNESKKLGLEKGVYPNSKGDLKRNATVTTIAPTGTLSQIVDAWGGIEPLFGLGWIRLVPSMNNLKLYNFHHIFKEKLEQLELYNEEILQKISDNHGSIQGLKEIPNEIQKVFVVTSDISPEWHIKMQAAFQNNGTDNAVSKTINLPKEATVEDIKKAYMLAYELGCKGITIYRDGSLDGQPLTTSSMPENNQIESKQFIKPKKRPKKLPGDTQDYNVGCGKLYLTINHDENGNPFESFVNLGTEGVCAGFSVGLSRMISLALRSGIDPEDVIDQLTSVKCPNCKGKKVEAKSCPDAYGKAIKAVLKKQNDEKQDVQITNKNESDTNDSKIVCPECGLNMIPESGCYTCVCGFSKCS